MPTPPPTARELSEQEFTAIEDRLLAEAPPGLSEQDLDRWLEPRLQAAVAESEYGPAKAPAQTVGHAVSNAWEVLNPVEQVKGLYQMASHPWATLESTFGASADQADKGVEAVRKGNLGEAAGRFGASFPLVGPLLGAVGDKAASGDLAGAAGMGAGLAAPFVAGKAITGAKALVPAGAGERAATALTRGAESRVADVMTPKVGANKMRFGGMAEKVAPTIAQDRGLTSSFSRQGLHDKIGHRLVLAEQGLDAAADARLAARSFPTQPIVDTLRAKRRELTMEAVEASRTMREAVAPSAGAQRLHARDLSRFNAEERAAIHAHDAELAALRTADAEAEATYASEVASGMRREEEAVATHQTAAQALKQRERAFVLQWLADDLEEFPFQPGGMTKQAQDRAFREWVPGDPEHLKYGIGPMSERVAGTKTYHTVDGLVSGSYATKSARLAKEARKLQAGKGNPRFEALADAYLEALSRREDGYPGLDFARTTDETVARLGAKDRGAGRHWAFHSPSMPPRATHDPGIAARLFGEDYVRTDVPDAQAVPDPVMPEPGAMPVPPTPSTPPTRTPGTPPTPPQPSYRAVPLGENVVPGPHADRVAQIDQAIAELQRLGPVARYDPLKVMRQSYDGPAKVVYSPSMTDDFLKKKGAQLGAADVTGALREALAKMDPATAAANAEYSLWRKAHDVLEATAAVERTRPKVGRQIAARVVGTLVGSKAGPVGAMAGAALGPVFDALLNSGATTQLRSARVMTRLATALRRGDAAAAQTAATELRALIKRSVPAAAAAVQTVTTTNPSGSREPAPAGMRP
jgi:hypothetical protein